MSLCLLEQNSQVLQRFGLRLGLGLGFDQNNQVLQHIRITAEAPLLNSEGGSESVSESVRESVSEYFMCGRAGMNV